MTIVSKETIHREDVKVRTTIKELLQWYATCEGLKTHLQPVAVTILDNRVGSFDLDAIIEIYYQGSVP